MSVEPQKISKTRFYPCFCQANRLVLFFGRLSGILPIVFQKHSANNPCHFTVSTSWRNYSYAIQTLYSLYVLSLYSIRLHCGPGSSHVIQWYVITFGYFITDMNSICSLMLSTKYAKRTSGLFDKLALLNSSAKEMYHLGSFMKKFIYVALFLYAITFISYVYTACLKIGRQPLLNYCNILDFPFAIIGRGFSLIFPMVELFSITSICLLIISKYKDLKGKTSLTLQMYGESDPPTKEPLRSLKQLVSDQREISYCLKETNFCVGLQLLIACVSSLYTSIYYLYRYSTSSGRSATYERLHYLIGLLYRTGKLIVYMVLGQEISSYSKEPLRILQNADLLELPSRVQQQVQTLILQWSNKTELLSAVGVVNMGLWLLAPIVGNVITYLLVALQFENHNNVPSNVTAILEYIF